MKGITEIRVDFSLRREVFYIVIGSIVGAIFMILAKMILDPQTGIPYEITWIAFGHLLGVSSPATSAILAGITIHMITALSIGIVIGVFLYKTNILIISYQTVFYTGSLLVVLHILFSLFRCMNRY